MFVSSCWTLVTFGVCRVLYLKLGRPLVVYASIAHVWKKTFMVLIMNYIKKELFVLG